MTGATRNDMETETVVQPVHEAAPAGMLRDLPGGDHAPDPEGRRDGRVRAGALTSAAPVPALSIPAWVAPALSTLLILSLISLATLTTFVQFRSRTLNQEITEVFLPARELVQEVQVATSQLNGFALTRDEALLEGYAAALHRRERALTRLAPLANRIGGEFASRFDRLNALSAEWNVTVPLARHPRAGVSQEGGRPAVIEQRLSDQTMAATTALAHGINLAVIRQREKIDASEREDWRFTLVLSIVAISAGLVNLWLGRRVRQLARESERRRQALEKALETKARLMRGLTHDLRNPLGAVDGYAEILQLGVVGDPTGEQRAILQRIHRAVTSSVSILDDVLELSRAEAGHLRVTPSAVDVLALLREVVEDHQVPLDAAGLRFQEALPSALPMLATDPDRVRQVLGNLLSNAIKYAPRGGSVLLSAAVRGGADGDDPARWCTVEVSDTGPGIPEDEQENIFEEFYRVEGSSRRVHGLGVGLAISRRIARLLGGDLTVRSIVGQGSAFALWLPLPLDATPA
jgi:signal transduction histidine kinase